MDFVSYIRDQSDKLNSRHYIEHLWDEIEGKDTEEISAREIADFSNHLPVLLEQFWGLALEKLNEPLVEVEEDLIKYLLVLIYQFISQSHDSVSFKSVVDACEVYLHLLATPQKDVFFKSTLYKSVLTTLQTSLDVGSSEDDTKRMLEKFKIFLNDSKLNVEDLEATLALLVHVIFTKSRKVYPDFTNPDGTVCFEAHLCLKILLTNETVLKKKFLITTFLFNGLRKHNSSLFPQQQFSAIQTNFRHLMRELHGKFKDDDYKSFLNAFIEVWNHPDFIYYTVCNLLRFLRNFQS